MRALAPPAQRRLRVATGDRLGELFEGWPNRAIDEPDVDARDAVRRSTTVDWRSVLVSGATDVTKLPWRLNSSSLVVSWRASVMAARCLGLLSASTYVPKTPPSYRSCGHDRPP
jgi:hypothetical protein